MADPNAVPSLARGDVALASLLEVMAKDGMWMRQVDVVASQVVFLKSVLEAYPGLCSVHAPRGRAAGERAPLIVACASESADEVNAMVDELLLEIEVAS